MRRTGGSCTGPRPRVGPRRGRCSSSPSSHRAATVAVGLTKLLVQRSLTADLERHLADEALAIELSSRSADFQEFATQRKDRRAPDFEGRMTVDRGAST